VARQRTLDEHTGAHRADLLLRYFDEARLSTVSTYDDFMGAAS